MRAFGADSLKSLHELSRRRAEGEELPALGITGEMGPEEERAALEAIKKYGLDETIATAGESSRAGLLRGILGPWQTAKPSPR